MSASRAGRYREAAARWAGGAVSMLVLVSMGLTGCAGPTDSLGPRLGGAGKGYDVLLVTLDTTRADHLGCYGDATARTPTLDGIAGHGLLFRDAVTVAPLTAPAHASILTGLYPPSHGVRSNGLYRLAQKHETLAEILSRAGYETAAFVSSFVLDRRFGFDQGFQTYDDRVAPKVSLGMEPIMERDATQVSQAFLDWLGSRSTERPFFAWLHYYDPHIAYAPPAEFARQLPERPYDGEIAYMDSQLGRVLAALESAGRLDRTLLVVVADHGEALGQHGEHSHGYFIYDEVVRVPLILSAPALFARDGGVDDRTVSVVDLAPTILDLLGIPPTSPMDGQSLLSREGTDRPPAYVESLDPYLEHGWAPLFGLRDASWKYIRAPRPELYDLLSDPGETANLEADDALRSERERLSAALERLIAAWPDPEEVARTAAPLDSETRARLQALGYAGTVSMPRGDDGPLADPKDRIGAYDRFQKASFAADTGRLDQAVSMLRELVRETPGDRAAWVELAEAYALLGRTAESEATVRKALSLGLDPDSLMLLAQILVSEGRVEEVDPLIDDALEIDPRFGTALVVRGDLAVKQGRFDDAAEQYRKAAEVDPYRVAPLVRSRQAWLETQKQRSAAETR